MEFIELEGGFCAVAEASRVHAPSVKVQNGFMCGRGMNGKVALWVEQVFCSKIIKTNRIVLLRVLTGGDGTRCSC